jgi:mono/diheme cytochrome c family protein
MNLASDVPKYAVLLVLVAGVGAVAWNLLGPKETATMAAGSLRIPELSPVASEGKAAFDSVCAACHGANATGTDKGPPRLHPVYNPGHHSDEAFYLAALRGARQHHWRFGDMPAQLQVSKEQVATIIQYVREMQRANGITYQPHSM